MGGLAYSVGEGVTPIVIPPDEDRCFVPIFRAVEVMTTPGCHVGEDKFFSLIAILAFRIKQLVHALASKRLMRNSRMAC